MFHKLFIANRGEVAVRVARTARTMGIRTVGAVSTADRGASWTKTLDELIGVGSGPPRESYLQQERLVQAAVQSGCTALHPGWGFLAENARFAALVEAHGVTFVGPAPRAMDQMGLKTPAKRAARAAGLPVIPGSDGPLRDETEALRLAHEIGFPVMVKADAGGGGRGMRLVRDPKDFAAAWQAASSEALAAFGDGACYIEKYLERGRHIEVQVMGDRFGNAIHLYERECSIQRKHQKLIEESCSPCLDDATRERIGMLAANLTATLTRGTKAHTLSLAGNRTVNAEIRRLEAQTALLERGGVELKITSEGLEPELEAFMFRIIDKVRVSVAGSYEEFLLGCGA